MSLIEKLARLEMSDYQIAKQIGVDSKMVKKARLYL